MKTKTFRRFPRTRRHHNCSNVTQSNASANVHRSMNEAKILAGNARAADFANMLVKETGSRGMSGVRLDISVCMCMCVADVEDMSLEARRSDGADGWA